MRMGRSRVARRHIRKFVGELNAENFERVATAILEENIIALDVLVDRTIFEEHRSGWPSASLDENKIILSRSTIDDGGVEINVNEAFSPQWGSYRISGIFYVKSGGMFQGVVCVGLIPTDEAQVHLNPEVKIIEITL